MKGTPMGSPIPGIIVAAALERLNALVFRQHRQKFWARYMDDIFVVIERDRVLSFTERMNAFFSDIEFTMEGEENNQLAAKTVVA
ncbi:unnamed protein product [Dibothriocephalus latus]|uniref:Reverse transcriptase domain-containing protein n=1 Tax=Dibothriocephalus latus TaxID=60516 RepID=A0A3P6TFW7_DIBLA|nr:unnamed protein product [Dibothriocephalus latus]